MEGEVARAGAAARRHTLRRADGGCLAGVNGEDEDGVVAEIAGENEVVVGGKHGAV